MHVERNDYAEALKFASALNARYPENSNYGFFLGYAQFYEKDYTSALSTLTNNTPTQANDDPDCVLMLAATLEKQADGDASNQSHGRALEYYRKAELKFREENYPTAGIRCRIEKLESEYLEFMGADVDVDQVEPSQAWLLKLSPREYFEMQTMAPGEISQLVRPMGDQAKPKDIVFFAAEHPLNRKGPWRIAAIYHVLSGPTWSPFCQLETTLELIHRMDTALEIDVKISEAHANSARSTKNRVDAASLGIYHLEGGVLDVITEAVKQRNEADETDEKLASMMFGLKKSS